MPRARPNQRACYNRTMDYLVTFLEGIITFISPCLLPMLPIYLAYFAGSATDEASTLRRTVANACRFVLGFAIVFVAMGAFAGAIGSAFARYSTAVNVVCGIVVIVFGLNFAGILRIPLLQRTLKPKANIMPVSFPSSVLFGIVFAIGWTPCVGVFLGSALLLASTQGQVLHGIGLLLVYSLGLGVPFVISACIIDQLAGAFDAIKRHYRAVTTVCGILLVIVGVLMVTGQMNVWLASLAALSTGIG